MELITKQRYQPGDIRNLPMPGYAMKKSLTFINTKYIPPIMLVTGTIINILFNNPNIISLIILGGMKYRLALTGMYEAMISLIDKNGNKEE